MICLRIRRLLCTTFVFSEKMNIHSIKYEYKDHLKSKEPQKSKLKLPNKVIFNWIVQSPFTVLTIQLSETKKKTST